MGWQVRASDTRRVREWINSLASQDVFSASQATLTLILFAKCEWSVRKKNLSRKYQKERGVSQGQIVKVEAFLCSKYKNWRSQTS
jgi:hypothetical protein